MAERTLTDAEINDLVGDDVFYWLNNPFMDRTLIADKVRWWISRAAAASEISSSPGVTTSSERPGGAD